MKSQFGSLVLIFLVAAQAAAGAKKCDHLFEELLQARENLEAEGITGAMYDQLKSNLDDKEAKLVAEFGEYDYSRLGSEDKSQASKDISPEPEPAKGLTSMALKPIFKMDVGKKLTQNSFLSGAVSADGKDIFFSRTNTKKKSVDIYRKKPNLKRPKLFMEDAGRPVLSPDGKSLSVYLDGEYQILSGPDFDQSVTLGDYSPKWGRHLMFDLNSNYIMKPANTNWNGIRLWKNGFSQGYRTYKKIKGQDEFGFSAFAPDGKSILVSDDDLAKIYKIGIKTDKTKLVYNPEDGRQYNIGDIYQPYGEIFVSLSPDQKELQFLTGEDNDAAVELVTWDIKTKSPLAITALAEPEENLLSGGFDPTGQYVYIFVRIQKGDKEETKFRMWRTKDLSEVQISKEDNETLSRTTFNAQNEFRAFNSSGTHFVVSTLQELTIFEITESDEPVVREEAVQ